MVSQSSSEAFPRSPWAFMVVFAWIALTAWLTFEFVRGESFRDDAVSLPALVLLVMTTVIGSRIFLFVQERLDRRSPQ